MKNDSTSSSLPAPAVALRPERGEDEAFLLAVYASAREEELDRTGWDARTRSLFLELQFRAMRQGYRAAFPAAEYSIILADGRSVGRAVVDRSAEAIHLVDLALLGPERNRGIGARLLRQWAAEAAETRRPLRLRVAKGSRAGRLYARLGFTRIADEEIYELLEWRPQAGMAG